jgi:CubicO group peptidase (beta-lactamase class C family)
VKRPNPNASNSARQGGIAVILAIGLALVVLPACSLSAFPQAAPARISPTGRAPTESSKTPTSKPTGGVVYSPTSSSPTATATDAPSENWPESTPEEQGMDSGLLSAMLQQIEQDGTNIHSLLIARHGVLVLEAYFPPFNRQTPHNLYSCTKSVTSALVGAALQDGLVSSINTPVYTLFPNLSLDDERKKSILVSHLLSMSSGLEWMEPLRSGLNDNWYILDSEFPAQYFFDRALAAEPGTVFNYNSGGSHLLSVILQDAAGETTASYATRRLFTPLGISHSEWNQDANGYTTGGTGLALTSRDLLKFGQLYLQQGSWKGDPLLPDQWVRESTKAQIAVAEGIGYGYQWWVRPSGIYNALGWGGQQVIVIPQLDMVVVFTAGLRDASWNSYDRLLDQFILPAAGSSSPLAGDPSANQALEEELQAIAHPPAQAGAPLPEMARVISGRTYVDLNGTHGWSTFSFHFEGPDEAGMELVYGDKSEPLSLHIGLDGIFRVTDTQNYGPLALKGYWQDGSTFVLTQQFLREAERITLSLTFSGEGVKRFSEWTVENHAEESEAVPLNR